MKRWIALFVVAVFAVFAVPASGVVVSRVAPYDTWTCSLDNVGATLTQCQAAPAAGLRLYLTDVVAQSTTATAGLFLIRTGTGTNCATGVASLLPSAATVVRLAYPANTAAPTVMRFVTPLDAPAASALCVIATVTNTISVQLVGFTAP